MTGRISRPGAWAKRYLREVAAARKTDPDHGEAVAHLRGADPVMDAIIERVGPCLLGHRTDRGGPARDHYGALVRSIIGQQLSTAVARTMVARVMDRFGGRTPSPREVLADDPEQFRAAVGLSRSKVEFLRDLAERIETGALVLEELDDLSDDQVAAHLTEVKGIGQWTVDMFLIFHLGRPDVLPVGDLGVRRAAMTEYRLRKLPSPTRLTTLARPWRPWRSVASWYLWASLRAMPA
jgi:DNA-3-methyladenine glycosylase II